MLRQPRPVGRPRFVNLTYLSSIRCLFRGLPAGLAAALVIAAPFSLPGAEPAGSPTPAPAGPPSVAAPGLASQPATTDWVGDLITFSSKYQTIVPLMAGPNDPNITRLTAHVLQQTHYLRRQLDAAMSERFLHRYLEMLDPTRVHFLESDLKEFQRFVPQLTEMTLVKGETLVAREIFARFLQRVEQRVEYVAGLLRENQFDFTGEDRYQPNRKDAPHPADEAAARALWKQHLRFEYLTEKLN